MVPSNEMSCLTNNKDARCLSCILILQHKTRLTTQQVHVNLLQNTVFWIVELINFQISVHSCSVNFSRFLLTLINRLKSFSTKDSDALTNNKLSCPCPPREEHNNKVKVKTTGRKTTFSVFFLSSWWWGESSEGLDRSNRPTEVLHRSGTAEG